MQLGHLLDRSGLTHPEVPLMVSPDFFYTLVCRFLVFSVLCSIDMLQPVSYVFLYFILNWSYIYLLYIWWFCSLFCSLNLRYFFLFFHYIFMLNSLLYFFPDSTASQCTGLQFRILKNLIFFFAGLLSYMWLKKFNRCLTADIILHCSFMYAYELRQWTALVNNFTSLSFS
jgi:hypothetical protein